MNYPLDIPRFENSLCNLINQIYRGYFFEDQVYIGECNTILDNHNLHTVRCSNSHPLYFQLKNDLDDFYKNNISRKVSQMKHSSWSSVNKIELVEFFLDFAKKHNLSLNHVNEEVLNIIILK